MNLNSLSQLELFEILNYNPYTGKFIWIANVGNSKIGKEAGHFDKDGYLRIQINDKIYRSHRLAFLYMTGEWPTDQVDHINLIKDDNKFCNLREATIQQNRHNIRVSKNNKLKSKGIRKQKNKYQARITINGKLLNLGLFGSIDDAKKAYNEAVIQYHKEFARID